MFFLLFQHKIIEKKSLAIISYVNAVFSIIMSAVNNLPQVKLTVTIFFHSAGKLSL